MCSRPDFEAEEQALDEQLLSLFHCWQAYGDFWLDTHDRPPTECIEEFFRDARDRLPELLAREEKELRECAGDP